MNAPEPPSSKQESAPDAAGRSRLPAAPRSWSVRDLAWLVVSASVLGGIAELACRYALRHVSSHIDRTFYLDPQAVWLAPLANLPIMAAAVGVTVLVLRKPELRARWAVAVAIALVVLEVAFITRRISPIALVVLAAGFGVQGSALAMRWSDGLHRRLPLLAGALATLSAAGGVAWNIYMRTREASALAAAAPPSSGAPNILLLILDTVRAWDVGAYGYDLPTTPTIDSLSREGIRFQHALATAPWTLPSHASIFTGRYPHELSAGWSTALDGDAPTLAERLGTAGYATGGFVGNLIYTARIYGLDRGFMHYGDYPVTPAFAFAESTLGRELMVRWRALTHRVRDPWHKDGALVTDEFLAWQSRLGGRPFFAFLNYFDAHSPYQPPAPFDTMFLGREPRTRQEEFATYPDSATIRDLHLAYDGGLRYIDSQIRRVLDALQARGVLGNTLVIVTADHGEAFGEHDVLTHGNSVYLPQLQVPLVIALPGRAVRDSVVQEPVTLRDLAATILESVGARAEALPGQSLARFWESGSSTSRPAQDASPLLSEVEQTDEFAPRYPVARGTLRSIVRDGWHYISSTTGEEGLYRYPQDSLEQHNLSADPALAATLDSLRAAVGAARRP